MYLVTGGAGFIGSNLARHLLEKSSKVRVLDDFSSGKSENLKGLDNLEVIEGSLLDTGILKRAIKGAEYILHQAAIPSVPRSVSAPLASNEANITGTLKLLEAAKTAGVRRFIFAASSSAYGDTAVLPKEETMPADPLSPYAVNKYTGELYARVYAKIFGLPTVSLRYFNIFGPYQDPASEYAAVIPKFILKMLKNEAPVIYGDGEQSRDFTYIENAVAANLLACRSEKVGEGEVINIACGESYTLNELVEALNEILGTNIQPLYTEPRPGDVRHSQAVIAKAERLLGYEIRVSFKEGLKRTVDWFKEYAK